ncbi:ATP-dependent zinc metalloprotease FtsH [Mycobacterium sp. pV006]|uniref:ATP-dependent zinc metalloprotease FtsH n=1 Tax=Mycobacterium sp. pV006 TaxID=3238983 RepID=UPI00351BBD60
MANRPVPTQTPGQGREPSQRPPKPWRTEGLPPEDGTTEPPPPRPSWWRVLSYLLVGYLVVFGLLSVQDSIGGPTHIPYTDFTAQVEQRNVAEVFSRGDSIQGELREPRPVPDEDGSAEDAATYEQFTTERPAFAQDDLLAALKDSGAVVSAEPLTEERGVLLNLLISLAPILLLFGFWYWLFKRSQKALGAGAGGMFGGLGGGDKRKPVDPESVRTTFADVAGIDEVKAEISEIVDYLRDPDKYRKLGARAPKGVLLSGSPGTGKTLLARATAGEADVPFFSASGSEFIEMIVGVGANRVRELFGEARKVAPAIIFIDEIDTIGRARSSAATVGGHDEREQTLNQVLTEMDGFTGNEGVVVLAATNRPDILDPALLRPGRFDRSIVVNPPDRKGRADILRVHTRSVPLGDDVDLEQLAAMTPGMTGADLANLVNEAALAAARDGQSHVSFQNLGDALEKTQLGTARNVVLSDEERRRTAYHEGGHALLGMLQPGADPVRKVSIIPRGHALGVTLSTPEEDRYGYTAEYLRGRIIGALGGMAAEEEVFGVVTTGAESDLETGTNIARAMVGRWGMSEHVGPVSVLPKEGDPRMMGVSDAMLASVDDEVRRLIESCYAEARELLRENRNRLDNIAAELLEHETLDEAQVYAAAGITKLPV